MCTFHSKTWTLGLTVAAITGLISCGDNTSSNFSPGVITRAPTLTASVNTTDMLASMNATNAQLVPLVGTPKCTVSFHTYQFTTLGGAGEHTISSAAIMTPSGTDPICTAAHPVLLYAHGTAIEKSFNMASPNNAEAFLAAATFATQGYVVVAPNYAGYDISQLGYHPYLIMNQQAGEMMDAWHAIKTQLPANTTINNKLFVAGYSQGGHVAMATQRAMQLAGSPVTAAAPMSGPYALGQFADVIMSGQVNAASTFFAPLLLTGAQKSYQNIYTSLTDVYENAYATGIESLLPTTSTPTDLVMQGKLPQTNLFAADSLPQPSSYGFGAGNLIKTSFRSAVLSDLSSNPSNPQHPVRIAAYKNDLLSQNWTPSKPMLLCGGNADPMVFYALNTTKAAQYFNAKSLTPVATELDVDSAASSPNDPFIQIKNGFAVAKAATSAADVASKYHGELVPPFCAVAARGFFNNF